MKIRHIWNGTIKEREKKIGKMMVWNEGEEYKISFFYRVVSKDVELSRNFPEYVSVGYKEKYICHTNVTK